MARQSARGGMVTGQIDTCIIRLDEMAAEGKLFGILKFLIE